MVKKGRPCSKPNFAFLVPEAGNEAPRSKLRGITELNFEDFSETKVNPVTSYGESQVEPAWAV